MKWRTNEPQYYWCHIKASRNSILPGAHARDKPYTVNKFSLLGILEINSDEEMRAKRKNINFPEKKYSKGGNLI